MDRRRLFYDRSAAEMHFGPLAHVHTCHVCGKHGLDETHDGHMGVQYGHEEILRICHECFDRVPGGEEKEKRS